MAATTITTTGPNDARIVAAVGDRFQYGRNATQAEVKARLMDVLDDWVRTYEDKLNRQAFVYSPLNPT